MELEVLKEWRTHMGDNSVDIYDYISRNINPEEVFLIGKYIYFPSIIKFRSGFFLESKISPSGFDRWLNKFDGDISGVEKMINHTHIYDLFDNFFGKDI